MSSSNDPTTDHTGRFVRQPNGRIRPLSPHLQVWRFHVTMAASITHRITGSALVGGVVLVALWLLALAFGPDAYALFTGLMASPLGLVIWFGLTVVLFIHLIGGLRHLVWDAGRGLTPRTADVLSWLSFIGGPVAAVLFWIALFASGRIAL